MDPDPTPDPTKSWHVHTPFWRLQGAGQIDSEFTDTVHLGLNCSMYHFFESLSLVLSERNILA
jgi:hypothetical protein